MAALILASASPRRKKILELAGYKPLVFPSHVSEILEENRSLDDQVLSIARQKLAGALDLEIVKNFDRQALVVSADTVVVVDDQILGKPRDVADAHGMLARLSGRTHQVKTAVCACLLPEKKVFEFVETSYVSFRDLTPKSISEYVFRHQPFDKAGSYGLQDEEHDFVTRLEGSSANVIGFPIERFEGELTRHSLRLDRFLVLAVSKLQSAQQIRSRMLRGYCDFGENYVREAQAKIAILGRAPPRWHFIGKIQSNKIRDIVRDFDVIHSVENFKTLDSIEGLIAVGKTIDIYIQINVAGEESKGGFHPQEVLENLGRLKTFTRAKIIGLMTMPPLVENNPEASRAYFSELRKLRDRIRPSLPDCRELSMGTTQDFKIALEEGSTCVRLGTLLFGERAKGPRDVKNSV